MKNAILLIMLAGVGMASEIITNKYGWVINLDAPGNPSKILESPLPMQAGICDVIGVGVVESVTNLYVGQTNPGGYYTQNDDYGVVSTNFWDASGDWFTNNLVRVNVSNYWLGNLGTNTFSFETYSPAPAVTNIPIVFFAHEYRFPHPTLGISGRHSRFSLLFNINDYRLAAPRDSLYIYDGDRSWFYASPENADLVSFASNLVVTSQISTNAWEFYKIIRDGYRLYKPDSCMYTPNSRIHVDSDLAFSNSDRWMPRLGTNFLWRVWDDPLLPEEQRTNIDSAYREATGSPFPRPPK